MSQYMERPGQLAAPAEPIHDTYTEEELKQAIERIIAPEDSYKNGVYW